MCFVFAHVDSLTFNIGSIVCQGGKIEIALVWCFFMYFFPGFLKKNGSRWDRALVKLVCKPERKSVSITYLIFYRDKSFLQITCLSKCTWRSFWMLIFLRLGRLLRCSLWKCSHVLADLGSHSFLGDENIFLLFFFVLILPWKFWSNKRQKSFVS